MQTKPLLPDDEFKQLLKNAPLVSIDLIIKNRDNKVLLGLRKNAPAKDLWFVPGGRIFKDETFNNAFKRITFSELGEEIDISKAHPIKVAEHFYNENKFEIEGLSTHYIVIVYEITDFKFEIRENDQHSDFEWFKIDDLINSMKVHQNTKDYFLHNPVSAI